jgi:hypothetical protein
VALSLRIAGRTHRIRRRLNVVALGHGTSSAKGSRNQRHAVKAAPVVGPAGA